MNVVKEAVNELLSGNIVALPTETEYGLAVDAKNMAAVQKLYALKHRSSNKPCSIAIADPKDIKHWVKAVSGDAQKLIDAFWAWALTLVLSASSDIPHAVNAGYSSIGLRCSASEIIREVIAALGRPICLTSANLSGEKEATTARQIRDYFHNAIFIIEQDEIVSGIVSTVIDLTHNPYLCLREGSIPFEAI